MDGSEHGRPPGQILLTIGEGAAELLHLAFLDEVWTQAGESPADFSGRGRETLVALGNRVDDKLATAERHVSAMRDAFADHAPWIDERVSSALASDLLPAHQRETIERVLAVEGGNFAQRAVALSESLMQRLPAERRALQTKVRDLRGDGPAITDISHDTACGVLALATMGELILCPETGIACVGAFAGGAALAHFCA